MVFMPVHFNLHTYTYAKGQKNQELTHFLTKICLGFIYKENKLFLSNGAVKFLMLL